MKGLPFCPVRAIPIDMFPHTQHCELVILFRRILSDNEGTKGKESIEIEGGEIKEIVAKRAAREELNQVETKNENIKDYTAGNVED